MAEKIERSCLRASENPNDRLAAIMGVKFQKYRQAWAEAENGQRSAYPLHLDIDVTSACNFACPMCPAGNSGHIFPGFKKNIFLDFNLYQKALCEGAGFGLPSIRLGLTGEPLLLPAIATWVRASRESGVLDISLITNGRLLTRRLSQDLIEAGLSRLMISVDAASEKIYSLVRPGGDWKMLLANIHDFLDVREKFGSALPLLRLSFVEMTLNQSDRDLFEEKFSKLADYLSFQRYQNIIGAVDTDFKLRSADETNKFCPEPLTRLALHADGGLFPCCSDFGRVQPVGNLRDAGLLEAWNSEAAFSLVSSKAAGRDPCRSCYERAK